MNTSQSRVIIGATNLIALVCLSGCVTPGTGKLDKSLGDNGSFEIVRSGLPVNWIVSKYPIRRGDAEFLIDKTKAIDGDQSLKIVAHKISDGNFGLPWLFLSRAAEPGVTYAVSFWLRSTACVLKMEIKNEGIYHPFGGQSEAEKQDFAAHPPIRRVIGGGETDTHKWRQFRYVYKIPETDGSLRFELQIMRPCTLWIDDVRIDQVDGEPLSTPEV